LSLQCETGSLSPHPLSTVVIRTIPNALTIFVIPFLD
jgi:hypothetical protein